MDVGMHTQEKVLSKVRRFGLTYGKNMNVPFFSVPRKAALRPSLTTGLASTWSHLVHSRI